MWCKARRATCRVLQGRLLLLLLCGRVCGAVAETDPYLWLEELSGPRVDAWVEAQNERSRAELAGNPLFEELYRDALDVLNSAVRIPDVSQKGRYLYSLWQDPKHPRGIYRRTTPGSLRSPKPRWEKVIDVDRLARKEGESWSFSSMTCLPPEEQRCLVFLAQGGTDATVMREFDTEERDFVKGGFSLPQSKMNVAWMDANRLLIATDQGPGSMTTSGYPRSVRIWRRATPLSGAEEVFAAPESSVSAFGEHFHSPRRPLNLVVHRLTFWHSEYFLMQESGLARLQLPVDAEIEGVLGGRFILRLFSDWDRNGVHLAAGDVLAADPGALRDGSGKLEWIAGTVVDGGIQEVAVTAGGVVVNQLENVVSHLYVHRRLADGTWRPVEVRFAGPGALAIASSEAQSDRFYVTHEGFLSPRALWMVDATRAQATLLKQQPAQFDAGRFRVEQYFARSRDGTRVPYFVVIARDAPRDGSNPTHLFSYGGFRISLTPSYSGTYEPLEGAYGKLWLERGGVFVSANIRGGGEYGPAWHEAALLDHRTRAFEDFEAVAEDLINRKITSPAHLGIEGRSNGGLLVAATMERRPDLYGAIICGMPLLDMQRYPVIGAGASWMAEYGDPANPEHWKFLSEYSPYQNVRADARYPPMLVYSSLLDDRVGPAHARKMAARMQAMGDPVYYYENREGGHAGNATQEQLAYRLALAYSLLWRTLR